MHAWLFNRLASVFPGCLYRVETRSRLVALTLDDGPDAGTTPAILTELRRHNARATFFLIAGRVEGQETVVERMVAEGHELGNHFTQERASIRLDADEFERDLQDAHRILSSFGPVHWARPGSGWYSRAMVATMAQQGYRCALGSVYPCDAAIPSSAFATWYVLRNARPGSIVILHDGGARGRRTLRVLRAALPTLLRQGYGVVTLSELVASASAA